MFVTTRSEGDDASPSSIPRGGEATLKATVRREERPKAGGDMAW
jgi:hypothetical protein